jgi:hypothetical protein
MANESIMKRSINTTWLVLLLAATAIMAAWTILLCKLSDMMLYDADIDVAKSMNDEQLRYMFEGARGVRELLMVPMVVMIGLWMLAFFVERREHNKLIKQLGQPAAGR